MLVRKRKNRSGSTSVVVVDKSSGKFKELICLGLSSDESEIGTMVGKPLDIAKTVTTIKYRIPGTSEIRDRTLLLTPDQKAIEPLLNL